jgi:uncharacterized protein YndB with AHSA1/START domain
LDVSERRVELDAAPHRVWRALSRPEELSQWFGARTDIVAELGREARFEWPDGTSRHAVVEAVEPERLLVLRWLPFVRDATGRARPHPVTVVRFVLQARGDGTLLAVSESAPAALPPFPPEAAPSATYGPLARVGA